MVSRQEELDIIIEHNREFGWFKEEVARREAAEVLRNRKARRLAELMNDPHVECSSEPSKQRHDIARLKRQIDAEIEAEQAALRAAEVSE